MNFIGQLLTWVYVERENYHCCPGYMYAPALESSELHCPAQEISMITSTVVKFQP